MFISSLFYTVIFLRTKVRMMKIIIKVIMIFLKPPDGINLMKTVTMSTMTIQ